jgi:hypothetical protein
MNIKAIALALLVVLSFSVVYAQGAKTGTDISQLTKGAAIPLPDVNVDIPTIQSVEVMQNLLRPGNLAGVFVIVPDLNDPRIATELTLAKAVA